MKTILFIISLFTLQLNAQDLVFSAEVNTDNIALDDVFELTFNINGGNGEFIAPSLESFDIVGGPNVQTSIQITNGHTEQEKSFTYYLKPKHEGKLIIEHAGLETKKGVLTTDEIVIYVDTEKQSSSVTNSKKPKKAKKIKFDRKSIRKI